MHHPLGDALVIEVSELLPEVKVLHQRGTALTRLQRVVGGVEASSVIGGEVSSLCVRAKGLERLVLAVLVDGGPFVFVARLHWRNAVAKPVPLHPGRTYARMTRNSDQED